MSIGVRVLATFCVISLVGMLWLFVVSTREMGLLSGLREVASTWWGVTTLADLAVGLLFVSTWICLTERHPWARPLWIVAVFLLGNFTTLVYLLIRCRRANSLRRVFMNA
jgi:hypothetical protein